MKIRELKEMLSEVPEGLTLEQFDNLEVLMPGVDNSFDGICEEESGVVEFGDPCDVDGNTIDTPDFWEDINKAFLFAPHKFSEEDHGKMDINLN